MGKNLVSQRDFLTERGAWELRGIIEANSRYKAVFRVEKSDYGLFVIRSNLEGRDAKLVVRFLMVALKHAEQSGEIRDTKKNSD